MTPAPETPDRTIVRYLPPWRVEITTRRSVAGSPARRAALPPASAIARLVSRALQAAGARGPASIAVILSDDRELSDLNREAMGVDGPTDVLSFPLLPPEVFPAHPGRARSARQRGGPPFALPPRQRPHLGDVVVSVERAMEQARAGRGGQTGDVAWDPRDELALLIVHGCLHVCGWDHAEPQEEAAMRSLERRLLGDRAGAPR